MQCHLKIEVVQPAALSPLFAACCTVSHSTCCEAVLGETDVKCCQWAHLNTYCTNSSDDTLVKDQFFGNWIFHAGDGPESAACIRRASLNSSLHVFDSREHHYFIYPNSPNLRRYQTCQSVSTCIMVSGQRFSFLMCCSLHNLKWKHNWKLHFDRRGEGVNIWTT